MSSTEISLITFACVFGAALIGNLVGRRLPEGHLSGDSRDTVKVGTAMISTLSALVLGLLVGSAKGSLDSMASGFTQMGARIILLDRSLADYGPETKPIRETMRRNMAASFASVWKKPGGDPSRRKAIESSAPVEQAQEEIRRLSPRNDDQRQLQSQAMQISGDIIQGRWMMFEQMKGSLPLPLLAVLVFWLAITFAGMGLLAPRNLTVIAVLLVCALSASGAIFLILEMNRPLDGWIRASPGPLLAAMAVIGR